MACLAIPRRATARQRLDRAPLESRIARIVHEYEQQGTIPNGEAEVVHRGGGRYVSVIGRNALFHNPDDRGPHTVNPAAIARFGDAFIDVAKTLATS